MSKMKFKYWGICQGCGRLVGDATELTDFPTWAKSRNINPSEPFGERPVPEDVEKKYEGHPEYVKQYDAERMFKDGSEWGAFGV